jgi:hypothetical protein
VIRSPAFLVGEVITFVVSSKVDNGPLQQGCRLVENEAPLLDVCHSRLHDGVRRSGARRPTFTVEYRGKEGCARSGGFLDKGSVSITRATTFKSAVESGGDSEDGGLHGEF